MQPETTTPTPPGDEAEFFATSANKSESTTEKEKADLAAELEVISRIVHDEMEGDDDSEGGCYMRIARRLATLSAAPTYGEDSK